jgi:CSLREA domain-containing protein
MSWTVSGTWAGMPPRWRRRLFVAAIALVLAAPLLTLSEARASTTFTVTTTADQPDANIGNGVCATAAGLCSLRAAVQEANNSTAADTVVVPAANYALTIPPSGSNGADSGDLDITRPLTVNGAGATVDANGLDRLVELTDTAGAVTIRGLTLREGEDAEQGGALLNGSLGAVRLENVSVLDSTAGAFGGGISSLHGRLDLVGVTVSGNTTTGEGGGISVRSGAVTITGTSAAPSLISQNSAREGGGVHHAGEPSEVGLPGSVVLTGATVSGNSAELMGGGLSVTGDNALALTDTTVAENSSDDGAGLAVTGLSSLAITRGELTANTGTGNGAGAYTATERNTRLTNVSISDNTSGDPVAGEGSGAGLFTSGTGSVTMTAGEVTGNEAVAHGGGYAVENGGPVTVTGTDFDGNTAGLGGGGLVNEGDTVTLDGVTFTANTASGGDGGAIESEGSGDFTLVDAAVHGNTAQNGGGFANVADGTSTILSSTFWDNRALTGGSVEEAGLGGGVYSLGDSTASYENVTITGNFAQTRGGGFYVDADAPVRVASSTISGNSSPVASGVGTEVSVPPIPPEPSQGVLLRNTIVAGNLLSPDCNFAVGSEGGNFDSGDSCYFRGPRDRTGVGAPRIDAVADNGGATMTQALQDDSFAIDGGVAPCPTADQRGISRPQNGTCDMGAYEHTGPFGPADTIPPDTSIVDPPAAVGEMATFTFAGTDNLTVPGELLFECRIVNFDPADPPDPPDPTEPPDPELAFLGCPNPYQAMDIEPGANWLEVRAIDRKGNVDPTPAVHEFTAGVDTTPPTVTFTLTPPNPSSGRTAVFAFAATDDLTPSVLLEVECRLDSTDELAWVECASPHSVSDLTTGTHTFEVRAIDEGDNISPVASYTWTVSSPTNCTDANVILTANADSYVDESLTQENFGAADELVVRSSAPGQDARTLLNFPVPADIPANCELASARLRLTGDGDAGRTLQVLPLTEPWQENQVTWQNQPTVGASVATTQSGAGLRQWDVTAAVAAGIPYGFQIRDVTEEDETGAESSFASRHMEQDPTQPATVPQLVLRFDGPGEPVPPTPPAPVPTAVTCGQVITTSIRLTNDLVDCPVDGLVIGAPNVTVDLDGHTIDGPGYFEGEPGSPIELPEIGGPAGVRNPGFSNVHLVNGTVKSFMFGVHLMAGSRFGLLENLVIQRNATAGIEMVNADNGRNGNTIRGNQLIDNEAGLNLMGGSENSLIENNLFQGNLGVAIWAQEASGHRILNNDVTGITADPALNSDGGFLLLASPDNEIRGNTLADTGDGGLVIEEGSHRNVVRDNTFTATGDGGVVAHGADFLEVVNNTAHQVSDAGIGIGDAHGGLVAGNDVRFNPGGIELDGVSDLVVEDNDASYSGGDGIHVMGDSLGNTIRNNTLNQGSASGISIEVDGLDVLNNPVGNLVSGNTTHGNMADGISVTGEGHTLTGNAAHNNAAWGIQATDTGVVGTVDGGGNTANGNAEPPQCQGVVCAPGNPVVTPGMDLVPPDTQLLTVPANPSSNMGTARFTFTGTDNIAPATALRYECRLDPPPDPEPPEEPENWVECHTPASYPFLTTGSHTFQVRAVDPFDNADPTPATFTWNVVAAPPGPDSSPPRTTISAAPDDLSSETNAVFAFRGTDNATPGPYLVYECRLDGGPFTTCASGVSYPVGLGAHTFEVRAIDLAGNADPSPAVHTWTVIPPPVDETAPDTVIASGPDPRTVSTEAEFVFAADETGTTFQCSLDSGPFTACTTPHTYTGLSTGPHTFAVRAVDAAGNADASPALYAWTIGSAPVPMTVNCGQVITQSVRVTEDLLDCPSDGLVIGANAITLDLGGVTIDGIGQGTGIRNDGFDSVTITNGTVQQFDTGVALNAGTARGIVSGVTAQLNQETGVLLSDADNGSTGSTVRSNMVSGNRFGIRLADGTAGAMVIDNTVGSTAENAVELLGVSGNRLERNTIATTSGMAIYLNGAGNNVLAGNTISGTSKQAISLQAGSSGNRVEGNALSESEVGIEVLASNGNQVLGNEATGMNGPGVGLDNAGGNQVQSNDLRANKDGIETYMSSGNTIEGNTTSDNDSAGIAIGDGSFDNTVSANVVSQNNSEGISVEADASAATGNRFLQNTVNGNGGDGMSVNKAGHTITANVANNNEGWGIYAEVGNTDGGGNRATGNVEPAQCYNVVCDGSPPMAPEVNPPDTALVSQPPNPSGSTTAGFTFTGTDDNTPLYELDFQCSLDGAPFADCENPQTYSGLAPGAHTFQVRAVDLAGKEDPSPATYTWTVVLPPVGIPPDTSVTSGPPAQTPLEEAVIQFGSNEPDTTFQCSLDGAPFTACTSPVVLEEVQFGTHTLQVRAVDPEGNVDPTPAVFTWTRTGPPVVTVTSAPDEITTSRRAEFTFTANEPVTRFECSLDLAAYVVCASPVEYTGLAIGEHSLRVRAVDLDGLTSGPDELAEYEWTVEPGIDTVPPNTAFTATPVSPSADSTFSFTGTDDVTAPDGLIFECRLDSNEEADFTECTSPWTYPNPDFPTPLTVGSHFVDVRAVDMEDNIDPTPVRHTWTFTGDTVAPTATVLTGPPAQTAATLATFTFSANDPYATFECALDGAAFEPCDSPHEEAVEPGAHTLQVRATDLAGNTGAAVSRSWTVVDAPVVTLTATPASSTADTAATFSFTSSEPASVFACSVDGAAFTPCTAPVSLTGLAVGMHHFAVRVTAVGAVGETVQYQWTVTAPPDTTPPQTTLVAATAQGTTASFSFLASETGATFTCSLDGAPYTACTSPAELTGLAAGAHEYRILATDAAGNPDPTPVVHTWTAGSVEEPPACPTAPVTLGSGRDSWVLSSAVTSNKGSDSVLKVESKSGDNARALVRFELPALPEGCTVTDASLRLYAGSASGGRTLQALRVTAPWTENGVTWSNQPATGGTAATTASGTGWRQWSVAAQVNAMYASGNHGFLVRDAAENGGGFGQALHGREKAPDNPPQLVLTIGPASGGGGDTEPPQTVIDTGPTGSTTATSATFTFSSSEPGSTFACSLDGAAFTPCTSPVTRTGLALGAHEFRVAATDAAGNADPTPAVHTWTVTGGCAAGGTVTVGANADSWVLQSSASSNYGQDSVVKVDSKSGNNARVLVRFALPQVPAGCTITAAKLEMYASSHKSGRTLQALQVTSAWSEGDVRWNNQPGTGGPAAAVASGSGWRQWSVTQQVSAMYAGANHGFLIRDAAENGGGHEQGFHSREKGSDNPPRLVVTFG